VCAAHQHNLCAAFIMQPVGNCRETFRFPSSRKAVTAAPRVNDHSLRRLARTQRLCNPRSIRLADPDHSLSWRWVCAEQRHKIEPILRLMFRPETAVGAAIGDEPT